MACTNHRRVGLEGAEGASEAAVVETPELDLFSEQHLQSTYHPLKQHICDSILRGNS